MITLHTFRPCLPLLPLANNVPNFPRALHCPPERLLKLALPNLYCWLVMFALVFHLWLNVLGELTFFGDR